MAIHIIFELLLLGHILGDFYFQSDKMAEGKDKQHDKMTGGKDERLHMLALHSVVYALCMAAVLFAGAEYSVDLLLLWLSSGLLHFLIDFIKKHLKNKPVFKSKPFIADQALHILSLLMIWRLWGTNLRTRPFVTHSLAVLPEAPIITIVLGLLVVLMPVGILVGKGEIWDFSKSESAPSESQKGAGKMIGYLERAIVLFLLIHGEFGAIAFVVAAKSVARFPEITHRGSNSLSEYYLIGTLLSMVSVFAAALLLGLIKI